MLQKKYIFQIVNVQKIQCFTILLYSINVVSQTIYFPVISLTNERSFNF